MGEEIDSESTTNNISFGGTFDEVFPFYLSIGMSYDEFWYGDVNLVVYYKKAYKLQTERKNQELWLQGLYIYNAVETVVYNGWCRKEGDKARTYIENPLNLDDNEEETTKEKTKKQEEIEKARAEAWLNAFVYNYSK